MLPLTYLYISRPSYQCQLIVQGFKSYREQVETEEFSPKVNCVVGANGSGKTNFFHAIRFVLGLDHLRNEDRHALLHEGAGHQVLSAFLEIVFDNSDNRMPVDKQEVRLRRTIGLKKDGYYLDKKHITKTELMNLLESAGFSRSNSYYVVQQGKIAFLTLVKDSGRLDLLKEIGAPDNKRKQMNQVIQYLDGRLRELDEEKEELKKYQQIDKQRRSLEYAIYDKNLHDARQQLDAVEEAHSKASETSANMYNNVLDVHENAKKIEKEAKDIHKNILVLNKEKEVIEKQRTEAMRKHAQVDLDVRYLEERISGNNREREEASRELDVLEMEIQNSRNEPEQIRLSYNDQMAKEEEITKGIMDREKELSILYQKQGRATQFANKVARDEWLQKEVHDLKRVVSSSLEQEKTLQSEIQDLKSRSQNQAAYIDERETEYNKLESCIQKNRDGFSSLKKQRDVLQDKRKSLWERESELSSEIDKLRSELLDYEDKFFTAVEVTAGNSLFHVVVQTDEISTRIISPLVKYPKNGDVVPMLRKLKFSPHHSPAFQQVFGRTVICRNLDVATTVAKVDGLDCITLEGDQVSKKGGMTGGFYDHRRSKMKYMDALSGYSSMSWLFTECEKQRKKSKQFLGILQNQCIDQEITKLVSEQQKVDAQQSHKKSELEQIMQDIANAKKQKESISMALQNKENMDMRKSEMGKELTDHLSPTKGELLSRLNPEITELKENLIACKTELETNLSTNLVRRQQELKAITSSAADTLLGEVEQKRHNRIEAKDKADEQIKLMKDMKDERNKLKKFGHLNKKALDQYVNLTEQREELQQRQAELDSGDDKIKKLIQVLDHRKDESIERTFKDVARHFQEAFSELVPGGHGFLVMMKKRDADHGDDDHDEAHTEGSFEKYIGVSVEVSFTGQGETQSMKQLSGGQKTVVALSLIFAIQRCDPAPFYLFDEIDAALDPQYIIAVRNMIRRQADMANTQFITTTFRTELVKVADTIYGVTHKNRVSFANVISKDQALRFIEHDQSHNAE
ncbi:hypothetical protein MKX01_027126 [Papaver californicum]|nr:hypothetical protein MKX01_027126 [Papaver californicum]